jgi:hypothetical protein
MEASAFIQNSSSAKTMIVQHTRSIKHKKIPSVIRCIAHGNCGGENVIAIGAQNNTLYTLNSRLRITQEIPFKNWIRTVKIDDITNDGNCEIVTGSGDQYLRVFHLKDGEFSELSAQRFEGFVNTCAIADLNLDSKKEIIAGSWDKSIRVFRLNGDQLELIWRKDFEKEIHLVKAADILWDEQKELVVLFKGGGLAVLDGSNGDIIWEFNDGGELYACDVGPIDIKGYPFIVTGGKDKNLYFLSQTGEVVHTIPTDDRITSILVADVDGGNHNEVVITGAQKRVIVYEIKDTEITSLDIKWKVRTNGVINEIISGDVNGDLIDEILFAGYDCALTVLQDNYYGIKEDTGFKLPPYVNSQIDSEPDKVIDKVDGLVEKPVENVEVILEKEEEEEKSEIEDNSLFQEDNETPKPDKKKGVESESLPTDKGADDTKPADNSENISEPLSVSKSNDSKSEEIVPKPEKEDTKPEEIVPKPEKKDTKPEEIVPKPEKEDTKLDGSGSKPKEIKEKSKSVESKPKKINSKPKSSKKSKSYPSKSSGSKPNSAKSKISSKPTTIKSKPTKSDKSISKKSSNAKKSKSTKSVKSTKSIKSSSQKKSNSKQSKPKSTKSTSKKSSKSKKSSNAKKSKSTNSKKI